VNKEVISRLRKIGKNIHILYVEDNLEISEQFERLFRKVFKNIDVKYDGVEGITAYKEKKYDIVITDIEMPNMNGIEMIKEMKSLNPNQIIVVTSAYNNASYLQALIELGVEKFLLKPFNISRVFSDIAKIVFSLYREKREEQLQRILHKKLELSQVILDKMIAPIALLNSNQLIYCNEKFKEVFGVTEITQEYKIAEIFNDKAISHFSNEVFVEFIEQYSSGEHSLITKDKVERFTINVTLFENMDEIMLCFFNTESINTELDRLKSDNKKDGLTSFYTRETFLYNLEILLDTPIEHIVLCFGLKNIKEFIRIFGVSSLRDIYKGMSSYLQEYFKEEILKEGIKFYYFDTNHFVVLIQKDKKASFKEKLELFGEAFSYTNKGTKRQEPMHLDILSVLVDKNISLKKNIAEIESRLYLLKEQL